jgi:ADP-L-glycero-D-manno-heptose 6-epimerase
MKKAFLTGHLGFIGRNLLSELTRSNFEVFGVEESIFEVENWDINLESSLASFKPDVIFHVGACADTFEQRSQYIMERNYESTKVLVDWASSNKIPLIYSSSAANYGTNGRFPSNLYGWSKYVGEGYASSNGCISLRYFNVYGPGEENKANMASFFQQATLKNKQGEVPKLFPGEPRRDFVYIKDVISANLKAYENYEQARGGIFDVGTGEPRTFESALEILNIEYSYTPVEAKPNGYQEYTCADRSKRVPGWEPKFSLEAGLNDYRETLDALEKQH